MVVFKVYMKHLVEMDEFVKVSEVTAKSNDNTSEYYRLPKSLSDQANKAWC